MELIKWVFATIIALTVTLAGIGLAIGAVIFATMVKILGIFGFIAAGIAMMVKEKIDERSQRDK